MLKKLGSNSSLNIFELVIYFRSYDLVPSCNTMRSLQIAMCVEMMVFTWVSTGVQLGVNHVNEVCLGISLLSKYLEQR